MQRFRRRALLSHRERELSSHRYSRRGGSCAGLQRQPLCRPAVGGTGRSRHPERVEADGPLGHDGSYRRHDENTFHTEDSAFGKKGIDFHENEIVVTNRGLFGGESMRVTLEDGVATVKEGRSVVSLVQSQGDHLLVQSRYGNEQAQIRHEDGRYEVKEPAVFGGGSTTTMNYNNQEITRKNGRWNGDAVVRSGENEFKVKSGRHTETTTTVKKDGWVDKYEGLFGSKMTYEITGGTVLPG